MNTCMITNYILIREKNASCTLNLSDKKVKKVDHVKFLGVVIDDELNWEAHVKHLKSKLCAALVIIKRIKRYILKSEYINIFNSLFMSHLSYCISAWGGISKTQTSKDIYNPKNMCSLTFRENNKL